MNKKYKNWKKVKKRKDDLISSIGKNFDQTFSKSLENFGPGFAPRRGGKAGL